jgi:hypothetical protein
MKSRPAAIPQYLKSGGLAMFFLIFCVLFVPVVFSVAGYCGLLVRCGAWCIFFWMTSCTYCIPRSVCNVAFETYHGAFTIFLRIFDRLLWMIETLDFPVRTSRWVWLWSCRSVVCFQCQAESFCLEASLAVWRYHKTIAHVYYIMTYKAIAMFTNIMTYKAIAVLPYNIFAYCSICRVDCKFARNKKKNTRPLLGYERFHGCGLPSIWTE